MGDLEDLVNQGAFNELGGLHRSAVIDSSLIDVYVPFLPLERRHVRQCVEKESLARNISMKEEEVESLVGSLTYWPRDSKLFSITGCKRRSICLEGPVPPGFCCCHACTETLHPV